MAKVELKQPVVAEIAELFNGAKGAVVVDYRGLTVEQDTQLRKQLREAGVTYKVYKNTMIRFAAKGTAFEALEPNLEGPTALAVSKDPVQRSSSWKTSWKHAVSDHKLRSCYQTDRRAAGGIRPLPTKQGVRCVRAA